MSVLFAGVLSGVISFLITLFMLRNSEKLALVDVPNARSSHNRPMPKGAGAGIVFGVIIGLVIYFLIKEYAISTQWIAIVCGFFAMAIVGFFSDRFNISVLSRFVFQVIIAGIVSYYIGIPASFEIAGISFNLGFLGLLFAILWLVSITNFYNFMDGIDGLTATEALIAGAGIALFGVILKNNMLIPLGLTLSGASVGFLFLNFPPAKIFMGDIGSYALGFYIACFALIDKRLFVPAVLILGVFIFDTVVTLARRIIHRENWLSAHKNHFYQRAAALGYSHRRVVLTLSIINISLTFMGCAYLKVSKLFQLGIISLAFLMLSCMVLFIKFKEQEKKERYAADKI